MNPKEPLTPEQLAMFERITTAFQSAGKHPPYSPPGKTHEQPPGAPGGRPTSLRKETHCTLIPPVIAHVMGRV